MKLLLDAVEETRGERKYMVPLTKLWAAASAKTELATKRQSEGTTEQEVEVPIPAEDMSLLLTRFNSACGYTPDDYDRLWPHMMGRVRKELEMKAWTVIPLNRCGAEVEGSKVSRHAELEDCTWIGHDRRGHVWHHAHGERQPHAHDSPQSAHDRIRVDGQFRGVGRCQVAFP